MESFFGYGTRSSAYDGRRHVDVLTNYFATYQLMAKGEKVAGIVRNAVQMEESQATSYLKRNLYGADFLNFIKMMARKFSLTEEEIDVILSTKALLMRTRRTPAGYDRDKNIGLLVDIAYIQRFFGTINAAAYGQFIRNLMPMVKGLKGNISEAEVNKIFSLVTSQLRTGETDLSVIKALVIRSL